MPTDFPRLTAEEQKIAKYIAARLGVSVANVATDIIETECYTKLAGVQGLTLQVCEAFHAEMKTSREEAERNLKENLLHCAAEAALGGHDLGEWQETKGPGIKGYQAKCKLCGKTTYASRLAVYSVLADVCPADGE
jgi:hypothetical protein